MINKLAKRVADYLGIDVIPIEYSTDMIDDSRLDINGEAKVIINQKYKDNYIESAKSITH